MGFGVWVVVLSVATGVVFACECTPSGVRIRLRNAFVRRCVFMGYTPEGDTGGIRSCCFGNFLFCVNVFNP